jgi:hypothetical protein
VSYVTLRWLSKKSTNGAGVTNQQKGVTAARLVPTRCRSLLGLSPQVVPPHGQVAEPLTNNVSPYPLAAPMAHLTSSRITLKLLIGSQNSQSHLMVASQFATWRRLAKEANISID